MGRGGNEVVGRANGVDDSAYLVDVQNVGQGHRPGDGEHLERGPVAGSGVGEKRIMPLAVTLSEPGEQWRWFLR
jgi:hypothetical protein